MRNYYPLPRPITEEVPYTVVVRFIGGTKTEREFPSYSEALTYYQSAECRGDNVSTVGLRPTAMSQPQVDAEVRAVIAKL
jgi:hypothetical protein